MFIIGFVLGGIAVYTISAIVCRVHGVQPYQGKHNM